MTVAVRPRTGEQQRWEFHVPISRPVVVLRIGCGVRLAGVVAFIVLDVCSTPGSMRHTSVPHVALCARVIGNSLAHCSACMPVWFALA